MTSRFACPACGTETAHDFLYDKDGCAIFRCTQCGIGRTETKDFDPNAYYTGDYFTGKHADGYADYRGAELVIRREFAKTVEFLRRFKPDGRLLDVGCAYGFFLQEAKPHFEVAGIELAKEAADHARASGLDVRDGVADAATMHALGSFDVITLLDVIEHVPDPHATLSLCEKHLRPGGLILITTGDFGSLPAKFAGRNWRLMTPPQHLWFLTIPAVQKLAGRIGLAVAHCDHPWKVVPLSLITYQLARMMGRPPKAQGGGERPGKDIGIPVNLFDAMRVVLRKPDAA